MKTYQNDAYFTNSLDAAATATATSDVIDLSHCWGYSIFAKWTKTGGVLAGAIKTQKSNDNVNWIDETSQNIVDASGTKEYEKTDCTYRYVRLTATLSGGTATFYASAVAKGA